MRTSGYASDKVFTIPLPLTWLGKQPKGCKHTTCFAPFSMRSIISPVRNQPSPHWLPRSIKWAASFATFVIRCNGSKFFDAATAFAYGKRYSSKASRAKEPKKPDNQVPSKCFARYVLSIAQYKKKSSKPEVTTSPPSFSMSSLILLFALGWNLT